MGDFSKRFEQRINTRGERFGACNICGERRSLTEDHVPPQGVPGSGGFDLYKLQQVIGAQPLGPGRRFQNGVTFKSICGACNSGRLGGIYDPALVDLTRQIALLLDTRIALPLSVKVRLQPNLVIRSVFGHLLAIDPGRVAAGTMEESMKRYFLDPVAPLPRDLHVAMWLYPSDRRVQVRGAGRMNLRGPNQTFVFSVLKFFPVAFMVSHQRPVRFPASLIWLDDMRSIAPSGQMEVDFILRLPHSIGWPELPENDDMSAVLHGSGSSVAMPQKPRSRS